MNTRKTRTSEQYKMIGTGAALLGTVALGLTGAYAHERSQHAQQLAQERIDSLKGMDLAVNKIIILKAGANYRQTPVVNKTEQGYPENLAGTVPKGKELIVRVPFSTIDINSDQWIAFTDPEAPKTEPTSLEDRAKHTVYADIDALEKQGLVASSYDYNQDADYSQKAGVLDNGHITISGGQIDASVVATSIELPKGAFEASQGFISGE